MGLRVAVVMVGAVFQLVDGLMLVGKASTPHSRSHRL